MKKVNIYNELFERGFIKQETIGVQEILAENKITFYAGFDATADSLHIGSLMPIMAMAHLQKAGHTPICIIGGGTTMIGDPSGKTQMRQMLSKEEIGSNGEGILSQLKRYLKLDGDEGLFLNNADWLLPINYIEFLRDIGKYFRVNEMIKSEAYKQRLEREEGLSFIELNYQILQAYDFLVLFERYNCLLQLGGNDQWGNIVAGVDLIRKVKQKGSCAITFPLLTTARGQKMGKTEGGAVWLDSKKTSPYEFYQYWINTDDRDVERFLKFFTFVPLTKIEELCSKSGHELREAKETLAFEATKLTHGEEEAKKASEASKNLFTGSGDLSHVPTTTFSKSEISNIQLTELLVKIGFSDSKSEATKLIKGGGVSVAGQKISLTTSVSTLTESGEVVIKKGKKIFHRVIFHFF